jgi:hypothetical protein
VFKVAMGVGGAGGLSEHVQVGLPCKGLSWPLAGPDLTFFNPSSCVFIEKCLLFTFVLRSNSCQKKMSPKF